MKKIVATKIKGLQRFLYKYKSKIEINAQNLKMPENTGIY